MRVFLSWSGARSKAVALALKDWLPLCIQSLEPWMSAADVEKGARWFEEIEQALASADGQGIFCVTPENLSAPWLNYEAGVVSAKGNGGRVRALLIGLAPSDVKPPLSLFQLTLARKDEILQLLQSLNQHCSKPLQERVLERAFEANWPELEEAIEAALAVEVAPHVAQRSVHDSLDELIAISRRVEQSISRQDSRSKRDRVIKAFADPEPEEPSDVISLRLTSDVLALIDSNPTLRQNMLRMKRSVGGATHNLGFTDGLASAGTGLLGTPVDVNRQGQNELIALLHDAEAALAAGELLSLPQLRGIEGRLRTFSATNPPGIIGGEMLSGMLQRVQAEVARRNDKEA